MKVISCFQKVTMNCDIEIATFTVISTKHKNISGFKFISLFLAIYKEAKKTPSGCH